MDRVVKIANPMSKGTDCNIIRVSAFSITANTMMLTALCFDRLYSIIAPHHYRRNMTKRRGCVIVSAIWIISFLLSFVSFLDPHVHSKKANVICGSSLYKSFGLIVTGAGCSKGIMLCEQRCECSHLKLILSIITVQREQVGSDVLNNIHPDCFIEKLYGLSDKEYPKSIPITHVA